MELVFDDHDTWCDFCPIGEMFRQQMRLAIPVYLVLLYIPTLIRSIRRRNAPLFNRIVIGLVVYAVFTTAFFLVIGDRRGRGDLRTAAMWFLILAAAAAITWSQLAPRAKAAAVAVVLLVGAWAFSFVMTFTEPKMDDVRPYYVSYLVLLLAGVGGTLWLTRAIEQAVRATSAGWPRSRPAAPG